MTGLSMSCSGSWMDTNRFACYEVMPDTDTGYQPGTSDDPLVCRELPAGTFRRMQQHVFVDSYSSLKSSDSGAGDGEESRLRLGEEGNEDARLHPDPRADLYVDSNPVGSDAAGSEPREVPEAFTEIQSFPAGAHTGNFWHDISRRLTLLSPLKFRTLCSDLLHNTVLTPRITRVPCSQW